MKYDCLIVDDEELLSESTREYFNTFGVSTAWVSSAKSCAEFFAANKADLILLDINLGNSSGFDLCRKLRETTDVPILFISARGSDDDMLLALNIGGDDYVQKPYSLSVLLAKVKAVLKRYGSENVPKNRELRFTAMEYKLLSYLIKNKNRVVTKNEIFRNVWQDAVTADNTLNVHIRKLREKTEKDPNNPEHIKTVWGTGYIYEGDGEEL